MRNQIDADERSIRAIVSVFFAAVVAMLLLGIIYSAQADYEADLSLYSSNMRRFAQMHRGAVDDPAMGFDPKLAAYYYDAALVYNQIGQATGDATYFDYAEKWARFFAEQYALPANGNIPGFWNFTSGMRRAYERSGTQSLRAAVVAISQNGAYVRDTTTEDTTNPDLSREVAYGIRALVDAASMGAPRQYRLDKLISDARGHLRRWCVLQNAPYVRPFMVALTVEALVYANAAAASQVDIQSCAQYIWTNNWDSGAKAFRYTDRSIGNADDLSPQPDLNLLILPIYGWLNQRGLGWQMQIEAILNGGVLRTDSSGQFYNSGAYLFGVKQFNQNHRSAIPYLLAASIQPTPTPSLQPTPTPTPVPEPSPTPSPSPTPISTPCPRPKTLTLKYTECRINRIVQINGLTE